MKMTLVFLALALGLVGILVVSAVIVGYLLPVQHLAARSIDFKSAPQQVWSAISDFKKSALWRGDLSAVQTLEMPTGERAWRETAKNGDVLTYVTLEAIPDKKLVRKIVDKGLPFGGTWTFEIHAIPEGTRLTIRENGEVYHPLYRFVSRFVLGHHRSIEGYLVQLKRHLGEGR